MGNHPLFVGRDDQQVDTARRGGNAQAVRGVGGLVERGAQPAEARGASWRTCQGVGAVLCLRRANALLKTQLDHRALFTTHVTVVVSHRNTLPPVRVALQI